MHRIEINEFSLNVISSSISALRLNEIGINESRKSNLSYFISLLMITFVVTQSPFFIVSLLQSVQEIQGKNSSEPPGYSSVISRPCEKLFSNFYFRISSTKNCLRPNDSEFCSEYFSVLVSIQKSQILPHKFIWNKTTKSIHPTCLTAFTLLLLCVYFCICLIVYLRLYRPSLFDLFE